MTALSCSQNARRVALITLHVNVIKGQRKAVAHDTTMLGGDDGRLPHNKASKLLDIWRRRRAAKKESDSRTHS